MISTAMTVSSWVGEIVKQHVHVYTSMYSNFRGFYQNEELSNTWEDIQMLSKPKLSSVIFVILGALLWTVVRYFTELFILKPISSNIGLTKINAEKFPESVWKLIVHTRLWLYTFNLLIYPGKYPYFYQPETCWQDWSLGMVVPADIQWIYLLETSFYTHSAYASLRMDHKRKDTIAMVIHHVVTLSLLILSYCTSYYRMGLLVLILMDITDIELEFAKTCVYLRDRQGASRAFTKICEILANLTFIAFSISWVIFRLHLYPTKVMLATGVIPFDILAETGQYFPFATVFNVLLGVLFLMNIWWFYFIIDFLVSIACGKLNKLEDTREFEVHQVEASEANGKHSCQDGVDGSLANGLIKNGRTGGSPKKKRQ